MMNSTKEQVMLRAAGYRASSFRILEVFDWLRLNLRSE